MTAQNRTNAIIYLALAIPAFLWLVPTLWMLSLSFQPNDLLARTTNTTFFGLIPIPFTWNNYLGIMNFGQVHRWFINSVIVSVGMTVLVIALSTTAGYAFARIDFVGKRALFVMVMLGLMVPEQAIFIPLYLLFSEFGWHNSHHGLILPRVAVPVGVFLMTQYFKGISREVEEAAVMDGANRFQIFWHLMLPLARPAIVTISILTFLYAWNDYLWPLVSAQRTEMFTITLGLASLQGNFAQSEGLGGIMASGVIACLPVVVLFIIFQRYVIRAVALGGTKG